MKYNYHVIIIGAGGAGLSVASGCAMLGAKTALIEKNKMGGECLNWGCVPSKAFLKSAHVAAAVKSSEIYGISAKLENVDFEKVMERVRSAISKISEHDSKEKYTKLGAEVIEGEAVFEDSHTVRVAQRKLTAKYIVIATGSRPMVPPIPGLNEVPYLTNETIFGLKALPKRLIVLGGGPIGLELSQGFSYLGSEVIIIDMLPHLFPKDDAEVAAVLEKKLAADGVRLLLSSKILEVKRAGSDITVVIENNGVRQEISGDTLLVALGRSPDTKGLALEQTGVKLDPHGYIKAGADMRTNIKNIFACGDITGPYQFSHMAGYQGAVVVRNILLPFKTKADYSCVPWVTFTSPEAAHVGYTEPWAKSLGLFQKSVFVDMSLSDRAIIENEPEGFIKLVLGRHNRLIGATIVGDKAAEMIGLAALAVKRKMTATAFWSIILPYPTDGEIYKFASKELLKDSLKPWMKKLVQMLFLR